MENYRELAPNQMHGEWIIEVPPDFNLENLEEFAELLDKVLSEALKECSPAIKGLHGVVKFLDSIDATPPPNMTPAGRATFFTSSDGKEHLILIRISKEALQLACKLSPYIPVSHQALQICLHEIFESDYHLNKDSKISIYNPKHPKYRNSDQEVEANRKALATINKTLGTNYELGGSIEGFLELPRKERLKKMGLSKVSN